MKMWNDARALQRKILELTIIVWSIMLAGCSSGDLPSYNACVEKAKKTGQVPDNVASKECLNRNVIALHDDILSGKAGYSSYCPEPEPRIDPCAYLKPEARIGRIDCVNKQESVNRKQCKRFVGTLINTSTDKIVTSFVLVINDGIDTAEATREFQPVWIKPGAEYDFAFDVDKMPSEGEKFEWGVKEQKGLKVNY